MRFLNHVGLAFLPQKKYTLRQKSHKKMETNFKSIIHNHTEKKRERKKKIKQREKSRKPLETREKSEKSQRF